jgi:hypothetical protein
MVGPSCCEAMVEFIPLVVSPHYWCQRMHYLLAKVVVVSVVPSVADTDVQ